MKMRLNTLIVVLVLVLCGCKTNSTQHTPDNTHTQSVAVPLNVPSFALDAGLEVRHVSNDDIKKGIVILPDLGNISYYDGIETRIPGTAKYFDIDTKLKRYINWYFSEHKDFIKDNIAYDLAQLIPKYEIILSDSVKAYYYPNVYSEWLLHFDESSSPISGLSFLVVKTRSFTTILNVEYTISDDNAPSDMDFSLDSLGTIYLTELEILTGFDDEGNYYEDTAAPITHIIKVSPDSLLYEKEYINR